MVRSLGALLLAGVLAATAWAQPSGADAEIRTRPNGMELNTSGRGTQVFRRENGAWQIQNVHYSGVPTQVEGEGF